MSIRKPLPTLPSAPSITHETVSFLSRDEEFGIKRKRSAVLDTPSPPLFIIWSMYIENKTRGFYVHNRVAWNEACVRVIYDVPRPSLLGLHCILLTITAKLPCASHLSSSLLCMCA